jgi:hypothetical protein
VPDDLDGKRNLLPVFHRNFIFKVCLLRTLNARSPLNEEASVCCGSFKQFQDLHPAQISIILIPTSLELRLTTFLLSVESWPSFH